MKKYRAWFAGFVLLCGASSLGQGITQRWAIVIEPEPPVNEITDLYVYPDGAGNAIIATEGSTGLPSPSNTLQQLIWINADGHITARSDVLNPGIYLELYACFNIRRNLVTFEGTGSSQTDAYITFSSNGDLVGESFSNRAYYEPLPNFDSKGYLICETGPPAKVQRYDYLFGNTPPVIADSQFGISSGNLIICWQGEIGETYFVQKSSDLTNWTSQTFGLAGTGTNMYWNEVDVYNINTSAFYRVIQD